MPVIGTKEGPMSKYGMISYVLGAWMVLFSSQAWAGDDRTVFKTSENERILMLSQMREMQASIHGILLALEKNDMAGVAEAAATSGPSMMKALPMSLRERFPEDFQGLGMSTHKGFAGIAKAAKSGATRDKIISLLGENYGNCIACHSSFQFK
jgi:hypothetical protein